MVYSSVLNLHTGGDVYIFAKNTKKIIINENQFEFSPRLLQLR